jgi:hypothetical protein
MVCQWFSFKTTGMIFSGLASKPVATVSDGFGLKTCCNSFWRFGLKTGGGFLG